MKSWRAPHLLIGVGLYTLADASWLLGVKQRSLRRWMEGYDYDRNGESRHVEPLWTSDLPEIEGQVEISFRDLIELRFVKAFVEKGIGLRAIRNCIDYARTCIGSDRPFSSGRFRTDGRTIFLESLESLEDSRLLDLRKKQYVFKAVVEQTFRDLDLEDDAVAQWRPYHGKESIVLDPKRAFGQPIANSEGVPTIVLADAVNSEGSVRNAAAIFEVDQQTVRDAVSFHRKLNAA